VPTNHGFGLYDQHVGPARPDPTQGRPVEHGDLLPEGQDFQRGVTPTAEEDTHCRHEGKNEFEQMLHVVTFSII
jgi:hypothetical protein